MARFDRVEIAEWIEGRSTPMAHGSRVMPVWGERLSEEFERYSEGDDLIGATLDPVLAYPREHPEARLSRDGVGALPLRRPRRVHARRLGNATGGYAPELAGWV